MFKGKKQSAEPAAKPKRKLTAGEKREIRRIMESARGDGKPHTAQDTLSFRQMYPDGLCKLDDSTWSRCIEFSDVNYQLAQPDAQTAVFEGLCDLYNSHDSSVDMQISLPCRHMNREDFVKRIEIAAQGDRFDGIRELYTQMLRRQLEQGNNGLVKTKLLILTIKEKDIRSARARFTRILADALNHFKVMGVLAKALDGREWLELLHGILHPDGERFSFEWDWLAPSGLHVKDFIAPSSFCFAARQFQMGAKFCAASFLQITAPELDDRILAEMLNTDSDILLSIHIHSMDQNEAIRTVKRKITDIDSMKIDAQKRAVREGFDMDIIPTDTLSSGLSYNKNDVVLEFFTDESCTDLVTTWKEADGYFTVNYTDAADGAHVMTIEMTSRGLAEINSSKAVYPGASMVNSGYSDCTLRIAYAATMDSDNSVVFGDNGNPNDVVLTWKRSNASYYDTLVDDAHVYTYGIDLTKLFSDGKGNFANVEFIIHNDTDNYFVKAELNKAEGIYYVTDHVEAEADATHFIPVESNGNPGKVIVKGLEDDTYTITEVRTDDGYTLLKEDIEVVISQTESTVLCQIYKTDVVGLIQNDPRFAEAIIAEAKVKGYIKTDGKLADILNNMPQKQLAHYLLTASATVDGNAVNMLEDDGSVNAHAPLSVVNTRGFDLPETGDNGTMMFTVFGILAMAGAAAFLVLISRKKPI